MGDSAASASPQQVATAQAGANQVSIGQGANASNWQTPYMGNTVTVGPDGKVTQNLAYSQPEQNLFGGYVGGFQPSALGGANSGIQSFLNSTGGTGIPNIAGEGANLDSQMMGNWLTSVMPGINQQVTNEQNKLANQGLFESGNTNTTSNAADRDLMNMWQGITQGISGAASQFMPQANAMAVQDFNTIPMQNIGQMAQWGAPIGMNQPNTGPQFGVPQAANMVGAYNNQAQNNASAMGGMANGAIGLMNGIFGGGTGAAAAGGSGIGDFVTTVLPALAL